MNRLMVYAIISGFSFGTWPYPMRLSKLSGTTSTLLFSLCVFISAVVVCVPLHLFSKKYQIVVPYNFNPSMLMLAGVISFWGLFFFNNMFAQAQPHELANLFLLMMMTQAVGPILHLAFTSPGKISPTKWTCLILSLIVLILLGMEKQREEKLEGKNLEMIA